MNLNNRLERLEATNTPEVPLEWTPEERQFRDDINSRMTKAETTFYHEVCTPDELSRMQKLSTKASLIWYRQNNEFQ